MQGQGNDLGPRLLQREQAPHDLVRTNIGEASRIVPLRAARAFLRDEQRTRRSRAAHLREKRRTAQPEFDRRGEGEGAQTSHSRELPEVARQPQDFRAGLRLQVHGTTEIEHPSQADLQVHSEQIVRLSVSWPWRRCCRTLRCSTSLPGAERASCGIDRHSPRDGSRSARWISSSTEDAGFAKQVETGIAGDQLPSSSPPGRCAREPCVEEVEKDRILRQLERSSRSPLQANRPIADSGVWAVSGRRGPTPADIVALTFVGGTAAEFKVLLGGYERRSPLRVSMAYRPPRNRE